MGHADVGSHPAPADPEPQPAQAAAQREMLTVALLDISIPDLHLSIYDPACGTGGILSVAKKYLLLPTYGSLIAAINFERTGTTRIGRFVLNHSFVLPGLVATATSLTVGLVIAKLLI